VLRWSTLVFTASAAGSTAERKRWIASSAPFVCAWISESMEPESSMSSPRSFALFASFVICRVALFSSLSASFPYFFASFVISLTVFVPQRFIFVVSFLISFSWSFWSFVLVELTSFTKSSLAFVYIFSDPSTMLFWMLLCAFKTSASARVCTCL
jgi:hypothetical protein